jgi:uncharacterized protein (TIGR00369 family)
VPNILHFAAMSEDEIHFERLAHMYLGANIHREVFLDTELNILKGSATVACPIDDKFHHAGAGMHGAIYFKLMDDAAYFAAASLVKDVFLLTASFCTTFKRPFTEGYIRAVGTFVKEENGRFIAKATLYDAQGKILSEGEGVFARSKTLLTDVTGYL